MRFQIVKGTRDILPEEIPRWRHIENTARRILEAFGYREIRTPTFESTRLFARSIGETTDIVEKEMYSFRDRKGREITLRPEGTAPIIRAYIEHGITPPMKLYYLGSMFRYERPQKGRSREFYQVGIEAIGSLSPMLDAEAIDCGQYLLKEMGLRQLEIRLNSIGCRRCRVAYKKDLVAYIEKKKSKLCEMCQRRISENPFRILDCKNSTCKRIASRAPVIVESLCEECMEHFRSVRSHLERLGIDYILDPHLFRGLDYYTKTTFEFVSNALGAKDTILGGGRYDYLVGELGGDETPAIGWALGVDRLLLALDEEGFRFPDTHPKTVFVAWTSDRTKAKSVEIVRDLRRAGIPCEIDYEDRNLKSQLKLANRLDVGFALIVGDEELKSEQVILRDMGTGNQEMVALTQLKNSLQARIRPC
ncbi:hypothetical protein AMJ40_02635 [candidate division TA06 bacterium DG_26]|uniref:Histidine--tRNA ligase n=1 Tax=candidate division TA06 bacterium DG_26 TaxID=1703771 RepID=A0A0S7WK18_UNCT6|nr:MAG: hypothetical protein AMJ40_02635 [candidate division TA06 bacterium DG_26]